MDYKLRGAGGESFLGIRLKMVKRLNVMPSKSSKGHSLKNEYSWINIAMITV